MKAPFENGIMLLSKGVFDMKKLLAITLILSLICILLVGCHKEQTELEKNNKVNLQTVAIEEVTFQIPKEWILASDKTTDGKIEKLYYIEENSCFYVSYFKSNTAQSVVSAIKNSENFYDLNFEKEFKNQQFSALSYSYVTNEKYELAYFIDCPNGSMRFVRQDTDSKKLKAETLESILNSLVISEESISSDESSILETESNISSDSNKTDSDSSFDESLWSNSDPLASYYQELAEIFHADATYEKAGEGEVRFIIPCDDMSFESFYDFYSDILVSTIAMSQTNVSGTSIDKIYVQIQDPDKEVVMETMLGYSTEPAQATTTQINPKYQDLLEQVLEKRKSE